MEMWERTTEKTIRNAATAHSLLSHARGHLCDILLTAFALAAVHIKRRVVPVQTFSENSGGLAAHFV